MGGFFLIVAEEEFLDMFRKFVIPEGMSKLFVEDVVDVLAKIMVSDDVVNVFNEGLS